MVNMTLCFMGYPPCAVSSPDGGGRCVDLLLPPLFVHTLHQEPEHRHHCPDEADADDVGLQSACQWLVKIDQPTQASSRRQHTQGSRQEGGPEHEVARHECIASEEHHGDGP